MDVVLNNARNLFDSLKLAFAADDEALIYYASFISILERYISEKEKTSEEVLEKRNIRTRKTGSKEKSGKVICIGEEVENEPKPPERFNIGKKRQRKEENVDVEKDETPVKKKTLKNIVVSLNRLEDIEVKMKTKKSLPSEALNETADETVIKPKGVKVKSTKNNLLKRNRKGETALHSACAMGKLNEVKTKLVDNADPNTKDNAGWTPLHEAVNANSSEMVELLLKHGALPDVPGPLFTTPLHEAMRYKNEKIITLLIKHGANVSLRNSKGLTPFNLTDDDNIKNLLTNTKRNNSLDYSFKLVTNKANDGLYSLYPFMLQSTTMKKLQKLSKCYELTIVDSFEKNPTHLIVTPTSSNSHISNIATLTAVALGVSIVTHDWIEKSDEKQLLDWNDFAITRLERSQECVKLSYINRLRMQPKLFSGCYFYFLDLNSEYKISKSLKVDKEKLSKLVINAGGVVLKREPCPERIPDNERGVPFHVKIDSPLANCSHYIIYSTKPQLTYNMEHLKSLSIQWLIECFQRFHLIDP